MKRTCTKCSVEKELSVKNFRADKRYSGGLARWCRACHGQASTKWTRKQADKDPDFYKNSALRKHGTTEKWHEEKLVEQGGTCALCPATKSLNNNRLSIDHDHSICPGKYSCDKCRRGLLCSDCNTKLGYLEATLRESSVTPHPGTWTEKAVEYIQKYEEIKLREFVAQFPTWEAHPMWGNIRVPWPPPPADGARIVEIGAPALFGIELPEGATITGLRWDADLRVSGPYQGLKRSEYPGKLWSPFQDTVKITGADKPVEEI